MNASPAFCETFPIVYIFSFEDTTVVVVVDVMVEVVVVVVG